MTPKTPTDLLEAAVAKLDAAQSVEDVQKAHRLARAAVRKSRQPHPSEFVESLLIALDAWEDQRANGVPLEECVGYFERTLRATWFNVREWKYLCVKCEDTGWMFRQCATLRCQRPFQLPGSHTDDHTGRGKCGDDHRYVVPCHCERGQGFSRNLSRAKRGGADDLASVGKSSSRGFTKIGAPR